MELQGLSVVYLAEYPGHYKIGRSTNARTRLRDHLAAGATWFVVYPVHFQDYWALRAEDEALRLAEQRGTRVRVGIHFREEFTGLDRSSALEVMRDAVTLAEGGPVHEIMVPPPALAPRPHYTMSRSRRSLRVINDCPRPWTPTPAAA